MATEEFRNVTKSAPPPDVARETLVRTQTAITKIKEYITAAVSSGLSDTELTAKIGQIIRDYCSTIPEPGLREQTRKCLVSSAKKWHYEIRKTYDILNRNFLNKTNDAYFISVLKNNTPVGVQKEFRKILDDGTNSAIPIIRDYQSSVKLAMKALSAEPPKVITISKGVNAGKTYVMPLRNRAELAVRYEANLQDVEQLKVSGVKLVWTSSHPNCSPRCKAYQGRLWSLDGSSGVIEGKRFKPIDEALAGPLGDGNGIISGYNCRHRLIEYKQGSRAPVEYTDDEIKKAYAIDKKQRDYENSIRQMKTEERLLRASGFIDEAKTIRRKWRKATNAYQIYSVENKRAFYPYRYIIDESEPDYKLKGDELLENGVIPQNNVDISTESGIINSSDRKLTKEEFNTLEAYNKEYHSKPKSEIVRKPEDSDKWKRYDNDYNAFVADEPKISKDMKTIASKTNMPLMGLEYRMKGKSSYDRKVQDKRISQGKDSRIGDAVRFTFMHPMDNAAQSIKNNL